MYSRIGVPKKIVIPSAIDRYSGQGEITELLDKIALASRATYQRREVRAGLESVRCVRFKNKEEKEGWALVVED